MSTRTTTVLGAALAVLVGAASYGLADRLLDAPPEPRRAVSVESETAPAAPPGPSTPPPPPLSPSPAAPPAPALPTAEAGQVTTSCRHGACTVCVGDDCHSVGVPGTDLPVQGGTSRATSTVCVDDRCTTTTAP